MSRSRSRRPSDPARPGAPVPSGPSPADPTSSPGSAVVASDLSFRIAVDEALAQMAAERAARVAAPEARPEAPPSATTSVPRVISTSVPVAGMTCRACEVRIQREVGRLPGVGRVKASAVYGRVEIESSAPVPSAAIAKAIEAAGYAVGRTAWLAHDPAAWATAAGGVVLVAAVAVIAQASGLTSLGGGAGDLAKGGLLVALLLGLAAGVSTCMVLVGGLVLALSASFQASRAAAGVHDDRWSTQMRPALVFMAGRIVGYGVLGAALGALGASVTLPPRLTAALMIAVAVLMTVLGTRLTGLSPRIATWSPTLPVGLGRRLGLGDGAVGAYSDTRAAALGAASFFLPCGFTQAVQVYALSTGSPVFAGAIMATFAIGTAPGLLALAGLPVVVPAGMRPTLLRLVGVVVLAFAFVNAGAGLRLAGVSLPLLGAQPVAAAPLPPGGSASGATAGGTQALTTFQDAEGYSPPNVSIYAGTPTTWTVQSSTTSTCAALLVVPTLGIQVRLHEGPNTIDLPALPAGTLAYSCGMGMYGGQITIVSPPTGANGGSASGG
jgi:sulfite exporter TauE/SafE/copper chaperone CopZ